MNNINRMITRLKRQLSPSIYSALCIVDRDLNTGKWTAFPQLWDGVPGSGYMEGAIPADWVMEYDTADEAAEAVDRLFQTLNISSPERLVIIVDDVLE